MTTITKERIELFIKNPLENGLTRGEQMELARSVLASLDAEPAGYHVIRECGKVGCSVATLEEAEKTRDFWNKKWTIRPYFYSAAPAPVVPDERAAFNAWNNEDNLPIAGVGAKNAAWLAWQARASLCGNSALNVPPERPADSSNGDDVEAWFDEVWNACRAAMLQDNQRDLSQPVGPQVAEYEQIMLQAGNSPVTQDGWISCSERMPEDEQEVIVHNKLGYRYVSYFDEHSGLFFDMRGGNQMNCIEHILVTHWRPMPAPPQQ
ncbi:TPA: DUF551 domain-containing protein [Salmonella enterica subsp. enterica serovar Muenchen]